MSTTQFQRWGRITLDADKNHEAEAWLRCYTHTGQTRIVRLDKHELADLINQAFEIAPLLGVKLRDAKHPGLGPVYAAPPSEEAAK